MSFSPFLCESCSKTQHNLFISQLGEQTVAKERCRECHPKQIDIISSKFPKTPACLIGKISDFETLLGICDVSRIWNEFNSFRNLIFVDSKYPQFTTLDEFSIFRVDSGDKFQILLEGKVACIQVKDHDKSKKIISVTLQADDQDFTHEEFFQHGARMILGNYKDKENWMKRCELPQDYGLKNADWEIVNEFAQVGEVNLIRIISMPEQLVKPLETLAANYRVNLLRRCNQWLRKKDTPVKDTVAFLLWKRRLTEDKFQLGVISAQQRSQELEMYERALQMCFQRTEIFQKKMSRSQTAKNYLKVPFRSFGSKFRRHSSVETTL